MLLQKELCSYGDVDYDLLINESGLDTHKSNYMNNLQLLEEDFGQSSARVLVGGVIEAVVERKSKNGPFLQVELRDNTSLVYVTVWNETYKNHGELKDSVGRVLLITGNAGKDTYKNQNTISTQRESRVMVF
jgi:DNA polymerase III alpha subunit